MKRIHHSEEMFAFVSTMKREGHSLGFTPTMGALHSGHYSLINLSNEQNDITICSIFVNPTQFNNSEDLNQYPRTIESDCDGLERAGCDVVFLPTIDEIYPDGSDNFSVDINLNGLDTQMEGAHRPGHFAGVVQVVKRLLDIIPASHLYMGQKDYQQFVIIRYMIEKFKLDTELVVCPIIREEDGLAMSSRNRRLSAQLRKDAAIIYKTLSQTKGWIHTMSISEIETKAMDCLNIPGFKPEYFTIVDSHTLDTIDDIHDADELVVCTAVWAGDVRLIDNMRIN